MYRQRWIEVTGSQQLPKGNSALFSAGLNVNADGNERPRLRAPQFATPAFTFTFTNSIYSNSTFFKSNKLNSEAICIFFLLNERCYIQGRHSQVKGFAALSVAMKVNAAPRPSAIALKPAQ